MEQQFNRIQLNVNGIEHQRTVEPRLLLVDMLREDLGLTGTNIGCEHGTCGACTVLMDGQPVRSCLMFAVQADGHRLMTVEGLSNNGAMHPIQEAFREHQALQCGFCTPGFLMTVYDLLERNPDPTEDEIRVALSGNICRCTGYQHIIEAVQDLAKKSQPAKPVEV